MFSDFFFLKKIVFAVLQLPLSFQSAYFLFSETWLSVPLPPIPLSQFPLNLSVFISLPSQHGAVIVSNNILTAGPGMLLSPLDKELRRHFLEGDGLKKVVISLSGRMIITTCPTAQLTSVMGDQWRCWSDTQLLKQTTNHTLGYSDTQVITHSVTQHIPPIKHPVIYMWAQ